MQKLLTLTSLNLLAALIIGCGPKDVSDPEPFAFNKTAEPSRAERLTRRDPGFTLLEAVEAQSGYPAETLEPFELSEKAFFEQFKGQYKNTAFSIDVLPVKDYWYFPASHFGRTRVSFHIEDFHDLEFIELAVAGAKDGESEKRIRYNGPFGIRLDLEINIPQSDGMTTLSISDFKFSGAQSLRDSSKKQEKGHYKVYVEALDERMVFVAQPGRSIEDALKDQGVKLRLDSEGRISSLLGYTSAGSNVDINSYPDSVGFWKVANSPGQELNHRPSAGQEIMIKYVSMAQMRKYVAKKTQKRVHFKGRVFEHTPSPQTDFWELKNIEVKKIVPTAKSVKLPGASWGAYMIGIRRPRNYCHFIRHSVSYRTGKTFSVEDVESFGDKVILQDLSQKSLSAQVGDQNGNCDPKDAMYNKKKLDFLYRSKPFPVKYEVSADLVETGRL